MSVIEQESLNNINIEFIDNEYSYGRYGDFKVIIMRKNRYIMLLNYVKHTGKEFKHWRENKNNKILIEEVNKISMVELQTIKNRQYFINIYLN